MDIDIIMACDTSIYCVFFSTKTMRIIKINLGNRVGKREVELKRFNMPSVLIVKKRHVYGGAQRCCSGFTFAIVGI